MNQQLKMVPFSETDFDESLDQIQTIMTRDEMCCAYLGITKEQFGIFFHPLIKCCQSSGLSWAWVNERNQTISCITGLSYLDNLKFSYSLVKSQGLMIFDEISRALQATYQPQDQEKAAYFLTATTLREYTNRGPTSSLFKKSLEITKAKGYTTVVADCLNEKSEQVVLKMGFEPVGQIIYKDFRLKNGKMPFIDFSSTSKALRLVKHII